MRAADDDGYDDRRARTFRALGTFATLLVTDPDSLEPARALLDADLAAMDLACSRFRPDSELWRLDHARGRPVRVSALLAQALRVALAAATLTDGDVDPTCGRFWSGSVTTRTSRGPARIQGRLRQPPVPAAAGAGHPQPGTPRGHRP